MINYNDKHVTIACRLIFNRFYIEEKLRCLLIPIYIDLENNLG